MAMRPTTRRLLGVLAVLALATAGAGLWVRHQQRHPVVVGAFQDPFLFPDGTRVRDRADWQARRAQIKDQLARIQYGRMPGPPRAIEVAIHSTHRREDGSAYEQVVLTVVPNGPFSDRRFSFGLDLYTPPGSGPFPAIVSVGPDGTGSAVANHVQITGRGFIYACVHHTDLGPDTGGFDRVGPAQAAYPDHDWGSLAVWAWGAMRAADYLLAEPWVSAADGFPAVDATSLIVTGHSRRGKAAMLAGAFDERFALVAPNGSGCGGAGSYRVRGFRAETLGAITSPDRYKAWFQQDFGRFAGREADLPFDQHFLRALVAPRRILSTDATGDLWANPVGTQAVYEAAQPVFDFLDVGRHNAIHFRKGKHAYLHEDFEALMDFADAAFFGAPVDRDYHDPPFPSNFPIPYEAPRQPQ